VAKEFNLLSSGGSDFHGTVKPYIDLGYIGSGAELSYDVITAIKSRMKAQAK
jgi:hypothetical protein